MSLNTNSNALAEKLQSRDATREPTWVRYTLITIALIFFLSCLILPLILVFVEAFKQGIGVYTQALVSRKIKLISDMDIAIKSGTMDPVNALEVIIGAD